MIDTDTGEILATSYKNYILNFHDKKDVGFRKCLEWCMSAVRGVRTTSHKHIELRVFFGEEKAPLPLFPESHVDAAQNVLANVY